MTEIQKYYRRLVDALYALRDIDPRRYTAQYNYVRKKKAEWLLEKNRFAELQGFVLQYENLLARKQKGSKR